MPNPDIIKRIILPSSAAYSFKNASALTFWNALTTANGGVELTGSLYGITKNELKQAIDSYFITGTADGWLVKMVAAYLFIGGTASTHALNAVAPAGANNLVFINSPTQGATGTTFNGTTQYATTGITPAQMTQNNVHLSAWTSNVAHTGTVQAIWGALSGATQRTQFLYSNIASGTMTFDAHNNTDGAGRISSTLTGAGVFNQHWIGSRRTSTDVELYLNGVTEKTQLAGGGTEQAVNFYLAASNNAGTTISFLNGRLHNATIGTSLTDAEALSLYQATSALNVILGR